MEPERITARQIEAARRAITRHIKRQGRLWIRIFPDVPVSKKPAEVRQGKGKGAVEYWAARVKPGRILFELDGVPGPLAASRFRARRDEAADQDQGRRPPRRHLAPGRRMMAKTKTRARSQTCASRPTTSSAADLAELKREQFNLRFQAATNQLERPARIKEVRRDIARIKTLQTERYCRSAARRKEPTMPKRILVGTVVSDKTDKTVIVQVERKVKHPLYGKIIRRSKKYHAHDEDNAFKAGETRPHRGDAADSKLKTWKVLDRVQAGKAAAVEADV